MAFNYFAITFCSFLLVALVFPSMTNAYAPSNKTAKQTDVVVQGKVYCQSCENYGTWSLSGAKPIPGAKISVTCKSHRGLVSYYKAYETDAQGYFYAQLDGFKMSNSLLDHPLHACRVKLVSSSLPTCSLLSNINYGMYGAPLRSSNKILRGAHYEAVVYTAGPLAFHPDACPAATKTHA